MTNSDYFTSPKFEAYLEDTVQGIALGGGFTEEDRSILLNLALDTVVRENPSLTPHDIERVREVARDIVRVYDF